MTHETRRLLAIDVGSKTLGLALYTPAADLVTPLETVKRGKWADDAAALRQTVAEYAIEAFIVGYPLETDGTEGKRCQSVRAFIRNLENERLVRDIIRQDERYSSAAAEEALLAIDASRETRRAVNDAVAAQFILQGFLERD